MSIILIWKCKPLRRINQKIETIPSFSIGYVKNNNIDLYTLPKTVININQLALATNTKYVYENVIIIINKSLMFNFLPLLALHKSMLAEPNKSSYR